MSIFDPYVLLSNITVAGKILMQPLWKYNLAWDDEIPDTFYGRWADWLCEVKKVRDFKIDRCHFYNLYNSSNELHIFSDASEEAMATVGYWRIETNSGYKILFVCGKTNCAPTRYHSWRNGPAFLSLPKNLWPNCNPPHIEPDLELRTKYVLSTGNSTSLFDFNRFSNYRRLKRAMAWVIRFIVNSKMPNHDKRIKSDLSTEEEEQAERTLCHMVQQMEYYSEYSCLNKNKPIDRSSDLKTLCRYLYEQGLLRVCGRIDNATCISINSKRPYILPRKNRFTKLLIFWYHCKFNHINTDTVISE